MVPVFEAFSEYIVEINRCLQRIKELEMSRFGLHARHTMCLYYLGRHPEGLSPGNLTRLCCEDKAAVSRTLTQLENSELIFRDMPKDKRAYRTVYKLTGKGEHLFQNLNDRVQAALAGCCIEMDEAKREEFYGSLKQILENLRAYIRSADDAGI